MQYEYDKILISTQIHSKDLPTRYNKVTPENFNKYAFFKVANFTIFLENVLKINNMLKFTNWAPNVKQQTPSEEYNRRMDFLLYYITGNLSATRSKRPI